MQAMNEKSSEIEIGETVSKCLVLSYRNLHALKSKIGYKSSEELQLIRES